MAGPTLSEFAFTFNTPMKTSIKPLTKRPAWKALAAHCKKSRALHLRKLFSADPKRGESMTAEAVGLFLDYSKNRVTAQTLKLLLQLAEEADLRARIDAMFRGENDHRTETKIGDVHAVLDKMADFAERVRSGAWKGHTGKRIRNVINIGIGGSDLGPVMAYEALKHYSEPAPAGLTFRFVSNVDGADLLEVSTIV